MKLLDLHLRSGRKPEYVDAAGVLRWQDPSLQTRGAGAGVVSRDYFLERLAQAGLEPVWILAGEKNVYAGQGLGVGNGFGGRLHHTTVFTIDGGSLKPFGQKTDMHPASEEQLKALRADAKGGPGCEARAGQRAARTQPGEHHRSVLWFFRTQCNAGRCGPLQDERHCGTVEARRPDPDSRVGRPDDRLPPTGCGAQSA